MRLATNILCLLVVLTCRVATSHAVERETIATMEKGTVAVDNASPSSGDIVTITVSPDDGYAISKHDITVEVTIDPGSAHAPTMAVLAVGNFLPLEGDQPGDTSLQSSYLFTMPEATLNVQVTAHFTKRTITGLNGLDAAQSKTGQRYNLMSQPVGNNYKGIVIQDGKKILVK